MNSGTISMSSPHVTTDIEPVHELQSTILTFIYVLVLLPSANTFLSVRRQAIIQVQRFVDT